MYSSDCGKVPHELEEAMILDVNVLIQQFKMRRS